MPKTGQILPMNTNKSDQRQVVLLCFDGIQILDVTGPASVFAAANDALGRDFYRVNIISAHGGVVQSNSAIALTTQAIANIDPKTVDICLVSGGSEQGIADFVANLEVQSWISQVHQHSHRIGSICTGAFALAELGLLNGKRVATHWAYCDDFMRRFPKVTVDPNALFIEDGKVWTSAGITTGIDMCLELIAADLGNHIANTIAKRLVLYARRPGFHSQFSPILSAQTHADPEFAQLIDWIKEHLSESLSIARLAEQVAMSDRSFHRKFTDAVGETPAHFIETLRLDRARHLLASGISHKAIAANTGYSSPSQLGKAFERRFGMSLSRFTETQIDRP